MTKFRALLASAFALMAASAVASNSKDVLVVRENISAMEAATIIADRFEFQPGNWQLHYHLIGYKVIPLAEDSAEKRAEFDSFAKAMLKQTTRRTFQTCLKQRATGDRTTPLPGFGGLDPSACTVQTFRYDHGNVDAVYVCKQSARFPEARLEQHQTYAKTKVSGTMVITTPSDSFAPRMSEMTFDMGMDRIGDCPAN